MSICVSICESVCQSICTCMCTLECVVRFLFYITRSAEVNHHQTSPAVLASFRFTCFKDLDAAAPLVSKWKAVGHMLFCCSAEIDQNFSRKLLFSSCSGAVQCGLRFPSVPLSSLNQ